MISLRNYLIRTRVLIIIMLSVMSLLAYGFFEAISMRNALFEAKKENVSNAVQTAFGTIEFFYEKSQTGELTENEAKSQAMDALSRNRYSDNQYFWINDVDAVMVMHPIKPELDNKDLSKLQDKGGKFLFKEFVRVTNESPTKADYVDYLWPKPGSDEPVPKISYVKKFEQWGWVLGSGIYLDDVHAMAVANLMMGLPLHFAVLLLLGSVSWFVTRSITLPLAHAVNTVKTISGDTFDLKKRLHEHGGDEVADVSRNINMLLTGVQGVVSNVGIANSQIVNSVTTLAEVADSVHTGAKQQKEDAEMLATAVNEMTATIQEVAKNASIAADCTQRADEHVQRGREVVDNSMISIKQLAVGLAQSCEVVATLEKDSTQISKVLDVINGVAGKTNLLALNAAIEAARAGDHGRGFAVVADEVRALAQRTQESTQEIKDIIGRIQNGTQNAARSLADIVLQANETSDHSSDAVHALTEITRAVSTINDMNIQIASASEEQAAVSEEINQKTVGIWNVTIEAVNGVDRIKQASSELNNLANNLQDLIKKFCY